MPSYCIVRDRGSGSFDPSAQESGVCTIRSFDAIGLRQHGLDVFPGVRTRDAVYLEGIGIGQCHPSGSRYSSPARSLSIILFPSPAVATEGERHGWRGGLGSEVDDG